MTRPSPRKVGKARVWKAWAVMYQEGDGLGRMRPNYRNYGGKIPVHFTRGGAMDELLTSSCPRTIVRVEIREVLPRKAGARRAR